MVENDRRCCSEDEDEGERSIEMTTIAASTKTPTIDDEQIDDDNTSIAYINIRLIDVSIFSSILSITFALFAVVIGKLNEHPHQPNATTTMLTQKYGSQIYDCKVCTRSMTKSIDLFRIGITFRISRVYRR